ncbi:hypothetical protein N9Z12_02495 [Opitutaceae bacterium]|nr:hypothetical protein [Opitutaceae bacterium]
MKSLFSLIIAGGLVAGSAFASEITTHIANLNSADYAVRQNARLDLRQTLVDASGSKLRGFEKELIAAIGPGHDFATRDWSIRMLELVGNSAAVKPLAALLNDPDSRIVDLARRALSALPTSAADTTLEKQTVAVGSSEKSAYADALAYRGKPRARNELDDVLFAGSSDAALALGKIGSRSSRAALLEAHANADSQLKHDIELALLDAGLTDKKLAGLLARSGQSPAIQAGAFDQLLRLDSGDAWQRLGEVLRDPSDVNRRVLLRKAMLSSLADDVVALLPNLSSPVQSVVLGSIADAGMTNYESAVLPLLKSGSEMVSTHAVQTLGIIGTDESYQPLLDLYLANPRDRTVSAALARLRAPSADEKLLNTVSRPGSGADGAAALQLLVLRNSAGVLETINRLAQPGNESAIREAAFRGMESIGDSGSIAILLNIVLSADPDKRQAQGSLKKLSASLAVPDYLWNGFYAPALRAAPSDELRRDVLAILDGSSGPAAAAYLENLILSDHALRPEALKSLQRWTDISGGDVWLAIAAAKNSSAQEKKMAQTNIVRLLKSNRITGGEGQRIMLAKQAILLSPDKDDQQAVLDIYSGRVSRGIRGQILRHFPDLVGNRNVKVDVAGLLKKLE